MNNGNNIENLIRDLELKYITLSQNYRLDAGDIKSQKKFFGPILTFAKRAIRKSIYWFINPYVEQQNMFNENVVILLNDIIEIQKNLIGKDLILDIKDELYSGEKPRVIQIVSSLNFGDAVGNDVIAIKNALKEKGYITEIFVESIHHKIAPGTAKYLSKMPELNENDIVIYHLASQCNISEMIKKMPCKKILRYHNITPPAFFGGYDSNAVKVTTKGLAQVRELAKHIDHCFAVSEFNKNDLISMGYNCSFTILPILIQFEDYAKKPNQNVIDKYSDGKKNFLFVGRMAPNKKVEDVIKAFAYYKENYDKDARLFLVGSYNERDKYYQFLNKTISELKVKDVIFPGHINFDEILAYYTISDIFLCMSEHEGFCVPLVEAMYFKVPIIAYDSSAIASTLNGSGILLKEKSEKIVTEEINRILENDEFRLDLIEKQTAVLRNYDNSIISDKLLEFINEYIYKN